MFWAEIDGLDELERAVSQGDRAVGAGCVKAVADATSEGAAEARETHRYTDRTGTLTASIAGTVDTAAANGAAGSIVATASYASFVDGGTAPHDIHAKRGPNLTFMIGDRWISKPVVRHPGTAPDGFMGRAYQKAERVLLRDVEVALAEAKAIIER